MVSECFQMNAFTLDYCGLKVKIFYIYLQDHGTTQAMKPNYTDILILLACIVLNSI